MIRDLMHLHRQLTAVMPQAGTRRLADGPTGAELALERDFATDMERDLNGLYRYPLRNGLAAVPAGVEAARAYFLRRLAEDEATRPLQTDLERYLRQSANVGGQLGLEELGAGGDFNLTDPDLLGEVDGWAAALVDGESDISLTAVTADELATYIDAERESSIADSVILAGLGLWINARSLTRSIAIAATESVRLTRRAMLWTYAFNGITGVYHRCEADVERRCTTKVCVPWCGERFDTPTGDVYANIPAEAQVPLHPFCRCWYDPDRGGWVLPALIWTGFALTLLQE